MSQALHRHYLSQHFHHTSADVFADSASEYSRLAASRAGQLPERRDRAAMNRSVSQLPPDGVDRRAGRGTHLVRQRTQSRIWESAMSQDSPFNNFAPAWK